MMQRRHVRWGQQVWSHYEHHNTPETVQSVNIQGVHVVAKLTPCDPPPPLALQEGWFVQPSPCQQVVKVKLPPVSLPGSPASHAAWPSLHPLPCFFTAIARQTECSTEILSRGIGSASCRRNYFWVTCCRASKVAKPRQPSLHPLLCFFTPIACQTECIAEALCCGIDSLSCRESLALGEFLHSK